MDPAIVTATILALCSILLGINVFFLKLLVSKIDHSAILSSNNAIRTEILERQVENIATMKEDVAILKFAVLGALKGTVRKAHE